MERLRKNSIVETALLRPVAMMMVLLSTLVLGAVAFMDIPLELIPSGASAPFMQVVASYPNSTAKDVEEKITRPLEQELATTPNLDQLSATSTANRGSLTLLFNEGTDMDVAYRAVRDRVSRVRPSLPSEVREVNIRKQDGDSIPVAFYGINWPEEIDDAQDRIKRKVIQRIERLPGVGMVNSWGQEDREIRIEIDRSLAEAANLNIFEIAQQLSTAHFNMASGKLQERDGKFLLRSMANFASAAELEQVVVGPNELRLKDVASVVYDFPEEESRARYNGRPTMAIFVIKESQANTVEVCDRLKEEIEAIKDDPALRDFEIEKIFVQGDTIRTSLQQVVDSGRQGGLLALFVLIFFLQRVRLTLIIAAAIPLSMFMSLPFMYFSGQSINLVSLIGLMICIGLVVDNSVVVAENIARYRGRGVGPWVAALHGASEVALPITLATATTMVVFLPASLMSGGNTQFYMIRMVTPICVSLLASLFVALILIPLAGVYILENPQKRKSPTQSTAWRLIRVIDQKWKALLHRFYEASLGRLRELYRWVLTAALKRPVDVVLVSLLACGSVMIPGGPFEKVRFVGEENFGGREVEVNYRIPSEVSLEEIDQFFRDLEAWFAEHRHEWNGDGEFVRFRHGFGHASIFFAPPKPGEPPLREKGKEILKRLPQPAGWDRTSDLGNSDGAARTSFPLVIYGDDHETVQSVRTEIERQIVKIEGVVGIVGAGEDTSQREEMVLSLEPALAERLGVSAGMVGNTVAYALRGSPLPRFRGEEREIEVWIRYKKEDREELKDLLQFKVPTVAGDNVPLKVVTQQRTEMGEGRLVRNNKRVAALIRLDLDPEPEKRQAAVEKLREFTQSYALPEGVSFDSDEERRQIDDTAQDMMFGLALGAVFIFVLMGFLFESFVLPMSVLPAMPLAFVGVWWFLFLSGSNIDPLAGIGLMLLLGVVVNNAIVLVDFINVARSQGVERSQAIIQAGLQRFRPILMTALTTVGGMIPLAFSEPPAEGIPYGPFGKTLVGGMTTATILTLVVVPVSYLAFDNLRVAVRRYVARRLRGSNKSKS